MLHRGCIMLHDTQGLLYAARACNMLQGMHYAAQRLHYAAQAPRPLQATPQGGRGAISPKPPTPHPTGGGRRRTGPSHGEGGGREGCWAPEAAEELIDLVVIDL